MIYYNNNVIIDGFRNNFIKDFAIYLLKQIVMLFA